jgi:hypothetical protein
MLYPLFHASDPVGLHTGDIWEIVIFHALAGRALVYVMRVATRS